MKLILTVSGFLSLALGAVGIFLPLLPTTPFVLLAAGCFSAANPRLYRWLLNTRHFGAFIKNYRGGAGVPRAVKRDSLLFLWGTLSLSALLFRRPLVWGVLSAVGIGVTAHILLMKTADAEESDK
ncbi:MAG: YbaN family protein [Bacillota bacterium]